MKAYIAPVGESHSEVLTIPAFEYKAGSPDAAKTHVYRADALWDDQYKKLWEKQHRAARYSAIHKRRIRVTIEDLGPVE